MQTTREPSTSTANVTKMVYFNTVNGVRRGLVSETREAPYLSQVCYARSFRQVATT